MASPSFTMLYPIPGTGLYEKVKNNIRDLVYAAPKHSLVDHSLNFESSFSETKIKFAIIKATIQFRTRKHMINANYPVIGKSFEIATDLIFKALG